MSSKNISISNCEQQIENLKNSDSKIIDLLTKGKSTFDVRFNCTDCSKAGVELNARAFLMDNPLEIVLCVNKLDKSEIREVMIHELIHAHDFSLNRYNMSTCEGLASSEIRAAREAECEKIPSYYPTFMKNSCIRYHATKSTCLLFPIEGISCVHKSFPKSINDTFPFSK